MFPYRRSIRACKAFVTPSYGVSNIHRIHCKDKRPFNKQLVGFQLSLKEQQRHAEKHFQRAAPSFQYRPTAIHSGRKMTQTKLLSAAADVGWLKSIAKGPRERQKQQSLEGIRFYAELKTRIIPEKQPRF